MRLQILVFSVLALAAGTPAVPQDRGSKPAGGQERPSSNRPQSPPTGRGRAGGEQGGERGPAIALAESAAEAYFAICDYNSDGWISFKEAQASLDIDREGWAVYDSDVDGRIDPAEFKRRYQAIADRGGTFPPPVPKEKGARPPKRSATELLAAYDRDHDGGLDTKEVARALSDYGVTELAPDVAVAKLDRDASRKLEPGELLELAHVLAPRKGGASRAAPASSIAELFGKVEAREARVGSTPLPPRIAGPVSAFRRLDLDGDGKIAMQDLTDLQRPLQLSVRLAVLLATLDADGDGTIDESELRDSMRPSRP